uniref:Uncharacterized protein n=1 Tax=Romanomermis culicivorax TaxID=13658 RepID=A0A915IVJ1_ROMCU
MVECGPLTFWVTFAAVIVGCIVTRQMYKQSLTSDEKRILDAWRYSMKRPNSEFSNILVGIHCNVDLVISGTKFFSKLNIKPGRVANHDLLNTTNDFKETFSYYFLRGVPAERFVTDRQVFQTIVKAAESEGGVEYMIGGSAAIIANEISQLYPTADLYLIGAIGPLLKQLLHWNITHLKKMEKDELHLIIEYPEQHIWGHLVAPRASRFIVSHETFSVSDALLDMFFKAAISKRSELIIFAGIHLFQFQPKPLWAENLRQINSRIKQISRSSAIHLEVSCIVDDDFGRNMLYR